MMPVIMLLAAIAVRGNDKETMNRERVNSVLTAHQWTLVEVLQNSNDTISNIMLMMVACEKDNYLVYNQDGTYQVLEGVLKCQNGDGNIKIQGTWQYDDADTTLIEGYGSGRKIAKKIVQLDNEWLRIQYIGEGRKMITLTYLSEHGLKNEENKDLVLKDEDPAQKITDLIRKYLHASDHYVVLNRKDLKNDKKLQPDDRDKALPSVAIVPFSRQADGSQPALMEQLQAFARKKGLDFIITGRLDEAVAIQDEDDFWSSVRFDVTVLDVQAGDKQSRSFKVDRSNQKPFLEQAAKAARFVSSTMALNNWLAWHGAYGNMYRYYFITTTASAATYEASNIFGAVNEEDRRRSFDSTAALRAAIDNTAAQIENFLAERMPLKIKINRVEGNGKNTVVMIEAGNNIRLKEGELLTVARPEIITVGATAITTYKPLGEIKVTKIVADVLSYCSVTGRKSNLPSILQQGAGDLVVLTKRQE